MQSSSQIVTNNIYTNAQLFKLGLDPVSHNQQCQRTDGSVRIVQ